MYAPPTPPYPLPHSLIDPSYLRAWSNDSLSRLYRRCTHHRHWHCLSRYELILTYLPPTSLPPYYPRDDSTYNLVVTSPYQHTPCQHTCHHRYWHCLSRYGSIPIYPIAYSYPINTHKTILSCIDLSSKFTCDLALAQSNFTYINTPSLPIVDNPGQFPREVHIRIERHNLTSLPTEKRALEQWLRSSYERKDALLKLFYEGTQCID